MSCLGARVELAPIAMAFPPTSTLPRLKVAHERSVGLNDYRNCSLKAILNMVGQSQRQGYNCISRISRTFGWEHRTTGHV